MKKTINKLAFLCALSASFNQTALAQPIAAANQSPFPQDPKTSDCSVDQATFNSWFGLTKAPEINAPATAADSLHFPDNSVSTRCDFYKWSSRMFLWLSSPSGQSYVFDSVTFFDVSAEDSSGNRTLISNKKLGSAFAVRATKSDETQNLTGETGQAGGSGVLISNGGSIVYYGVHVNDVYAYFLSSQKNVSDPTLIDFPNTADQLKKVVTYANTQGVTLVDKKALTMELKTSWVDAETVANKGNYLTITAEVPNYTENAAHPDKIWSLDGTVSKELALVGMHIVGTVKKHPEMVWATVEHINNAPDSNYSYTNFIGTESAVSTPTIGTWEFTESPITSSTQMNAERAAVFTDKNATNLYNPDPSTRKTGDIVATKDNTIGKSSVLRLNPWGSASSLAASGSIQDPGNNAELISLNNDVIRLLPPSDVRANYFLSGAVWTQTGNIPTYSSGGPAFKQIGSLSLANSTMETYNQDIAKSATNAEAGCFMCHSISGAQAVSGQGVEVSHIYDAILPIPKIQEVSSSDK